MRLGFVQSSDEDLTAFGIMQDDLIHMGGTVQMHKTVAPPRAWKTVIFKSVPLHLRTVDFHWFC